MPDSSNVTASDYVRLFNGGYAGAWGWAYFNVTEAFNVTTGAATRGIGEHKCRPALRALLAALPPQLKAPIRRRGVPAARAAVSGAPAGAAAPANTVVASAALPGSVVVAGAGAAATPEPLVAG
jgi:hypothetical protein